MEVHMKGRTAYDILQDTAEEICNDYCRYSNGEGHQTEDGTFEECENCPFDEMGWPR